MAYPSGLLLLLVISTSHVRGDSACNAKSGSCQDDALSCSGNYQSGLCSGGNNIRCCVPSGDSACLAKSGTCQDDSLSCSGSYQSNLCSGGNNNRCCVPSGDSACTAKSGTCQDDSLSCSGDYESNLCSGGNNNRCCVPTADTGDTETNELCEGYFGGVCVTTAECRDHFGVDANLTGCGSGKLCCWPRPGFDQETISKSNEDFHQVVDKMYPQESKCPEEEEVEEGTEDTAENGGNSGGEGNGEGGNGEDGNGGDGNGGAGNGGEGSGGNCDEGGSNGPGDEKCTAKSGRCQEDSLSCSGGYDTDLCAGGKTRRCCLGGCSGAGGKECRTTITGSEYYGKLSNADGTECLPWSSGAGRGWKNYDVGNFPEGSEAGASNYCRNPTNFNQGPWCITPGSPGYKLCKVDMCKEGKECRDTTVGSDYTGTLDNADGTPCLPWSSGAARGWQNYAADNFPEGSETGASNYCRNPTNFNRGPWCITAGSPGYKLCSIPYCPKMKKRRSVEKRRLAKRDAGVDAGDMVKWVNEKSVNFAAWLVNKDNLYDDDIHYHLFTSKVYGRSQAEDELIFEDMTGIKADDYRVVPIPHTFLKDAEVDETVIIIHDYMGDINDDVQWEKKMAKELLKKKDGDQRNKNVIVVDWEKLAESRFGHLEAIDKKTCGQCMKDLWKARYLLELCPECAIGTLVDPRCVQCLGKSLWDARKPIYSWAKRNTEGVAAKTRNMLERLIHCPDIQLDPKKITCIGQGMGAHICGMITNKPKVKKDFVGPIYDFKFGKIIAMDPMGFGWDKYYMLASGWDAETSAKFVIEGIKKRLHIGNADFVVAIHTDTDQIGYRGAIGHTDIYVNGGEKQPGCSGISLDAALHPFLRLTCDHRVAHYLVHEGIRDGPTGTKLQAKHCPHFNPLYPYKDIEKDCEYGHLQKFPNFFGICKKKRKTKQPWTLEDCSGDKYITAGYYTPTSADRFYFLKTKSYSSADLEDIIN